MDLKHLPYRYDLIPSRFGEIGLVRRADGGRSPVCRILLPKADRAMAGIIRGLYPAAVPGGENRDALCEQISDFLAGGAVDFGLERLDFGGLKGFAKRVLLADGGIPRGRVMSYGSLAASVGVSGGARAVGNVMAGNPFPLVIPCHRVVASGGALGGFGGGLELKKGLLGLEGVAFDVRGRVLPEHLLPPA